MNRTKMLTVASLFPLVVSMPLLLGGRYPKAADTVKPSPRQAARVEMIAFHSNRTASPEIYIMNADGSEQARLTLQRNRVVATDAWPTGCCV